MGEKPSLPPVELKRWDLLAGDKVLYRREHTGCGGGEASYFTARVVKVHKKMVTIALWNMREKKPNLKRVSQASLYERTTEHQPLDSWDLDVPLSSFDGDEL